MVGDGKCETFHISTPLVYCTVGLGLFVIFAPVEVFFTIVCLARYYINKIMMCASLNRTFFLLFNVKIYN